MAGNDYSGALDRDKAGRLCVVVLERDANPILGMTRTANLRCDSKPARLAYREITFEADVPEDDVRAILKQFATYT
jgi:hypothetical protein